MKIPNKYDNVILQKSGVFYMYLIISLYEPTEEQRFSFMCERFNGSEGHIFDVTMIITNA